MPLSEHEQRLLEQMERQLYADDPKLASTLRGGGTSGGGRRALALGGILIVVGMAILVGGVAENLWPVGVVGFIVMLAGGWFAVSKWSSSPAPAAGAASTKPSKRQQKSGFMNRLEERWDRRRDGQG